MVAINAQAEDLNRIIRSQNTVVYDLLSSKGKAIYFPKMGVLAQGNAAKGKEINATIGTAYENDGKPMILPSIACRLQLDTKDAFPYAPSDGLKTLRDKWLELVKSKNPSLGTQEVSLPLVTCGVTHGLSMVGYMFAEDTDAVLLADLYWENYDLIYTNAYGAELKFFNFFKNRAFDIDSFKNAVCSGPAGDRKSPVRPVKKSYS
jgi:aspartate/tyrosine/aromatic aminotransferase